MNRICCLALICSAVLLSTSVAAADDNEKQDVKGGIYARKNLVAWCIVPFDGKKRGPAARAEMLKRLGLQRVAYDWRAEHVPTFEQEILEYKKHGLEYFAFWDVHEEALRLFKKHKLRPQIWKSFPSPTAKTQEERVKQAATQLLPLVNKTRAIGSKLGLYNHGGWAGEPANLVAVCQYLRKHHQADHVGIVYNQHHAHNHINDFAEVLALLRPYLLCLNLNGMTRDGDRVGKKILPLGEGEFDVVLMKAIRASGYRGPIGIIGHTQDDVEHRLQDNLAGLDWILPQLDGKPAGKKPTLRTWSPKPNNSSSRAGSLLPGHASFRQPPLTIECRATLLSKNGYNILVASDSKASSAHWELFSMRGSGMFTVYLPGHQPDHVTTKEMICDVQPHTLTMLYEANRVRLYVDGRAVADQKISRVRKDVVPGGLGIGRLVRESLGCDGTVQWVRLSRGIRTIGKQALTDVKRDEQTLLLWRADRTSKTGAETSEYSPRIVQSWLDRAQQTGDAHRGLVAFASTKTACLSCHRVGKNGGRVGPELSKLAKEKRPHEIIEAVLWPQRHVKPEYVARLLATSSGRVHRGYAVKRTDDAVWLQDPARPEVAPLKVLLDDIEDEQEIGTLMPDNLLAALSDQQKSDLFRFLLGLGTPSQIPVGEVDALLAQAGHHTHRPATFPHERAPLHPEQHPDWQAHVNRDRVYDFYAKQARHFRSVSEAPALLAEYPGLDGGEQGHWGNQNDTYWASPRWNDTDLGTLHCGIFRGGSVAVTRGVCLRLGKRGELSVCFNTDTLSYDAAWRDGFLKFSDFRHGFLNGVLMDGKPATIPRAKAVPRDARYLGFYRHGRRVLFAYESGGTRYLDAPQLVDGRFTRVVAPADHHPDRRLLQDAPPQWPQVLETSISSSPAAPYAIDTIQLPTDNPWKVQLFVGGLSFLPDGTALVCTMHGDVWRVSNLAYPSQVARWKRFASGLHHPLGMVVDKDGIFVLCRDQITRLHDLNDDGEADFYECFSKTYKTSPAGHDFICGLQRDAAGNFYTASGNQGVVRISPDGRQANIVATGFRNPDGLGLLPDGVLTVPCSEGSWTPASMICAVRPRQEGKSPSFHGAGGPRDGKPPELPLVYLPRGVDNSAGGQAVVQGNRWGPLAGQLLHFSFGTGRHFLVLRDEVDGQLQGAVVPLPGEFRSGAHRGRFNPQDGQLYVGGMQGWGTYTPDDGCLQRVRYTGKAVQLPVAFRAHVNGIHVTFSQPLDRALASDVANHFAQSWNYRYSSAYGSAEFSSKQFGVRGHDTRRITGAHVVGDGRSLFLEIPDLQPVNQLHLLISTNAGIDRQMFATIHQLAAAFEDFPGYRPQGKTIAPHPIKTDLAFALRSQPNPFRGKLPGARRIKLRTATSLAYGVASFRVRAGEPIELTLINPDVVPHNWALIKPGTLFRVGRLANRMIGDPDAAIRQYVPESSDVLAYTDVVLPGDQFTIFFRAPQVPGRYPYLCTFPGHWLAMNGEMIVEAAPAK